MPSRRSVLGIATLGAMASACSPPPDNQTPNDTPKSSGQGQTSPLPPPIGAGVKGLAIPAHELSGLADPELSGVMGQVKDLGCRWIRFDFYWDGIEPSPGRYQWDETDRLVEHSRAAGLEVLGLLHTMPTWLRGDFKPLVTGPVTQRQLHHWAALCEQAAAHFAGRVKAWELWNEPNLEAFWAPRPSPSAYAAAVRAAWPGIRAADPSALVITGGPGGPTRPRELDPLSFLSKALDAGMAGHFHAMALHPYTNLTGAPDGALGQAIDIHLELVRRGLGSTPLWGTETGAPTSGTDGVVISTAAQAALVRSTYDFWRSKVPGAGPLFWYTLNDSGNRSRYGSFGLVSPDGSPKPAHSTFRDLSS